MSNAEHFQEPPDCVSREQIVGAFRYWVTRAKQAEKKLAEFGQIWDGEKYVFDGRESFSREAGTQEKK